MNKLQVAWMAIFTAVLVWSGIGPHDYPTWLLEVTPATLRLRKKQLKETHRKREARQKAS